MAGFCLSADGDSHAFMICFISYATLLIPALFSGCSALQYNMYLCAQAA